MSPSLQKKRGTPSRRQAGPSRSSTPTAPCSPRTGTALRSTIASTVDARRTLKPGPPIAGPSAMARADAAVHVWCEDRSCFWSPAPLSDVYRERHEVQEAMVIGIPIVLLLAAGGGLWLASIGLRPITGDGAARVADSADRPGGSRRVEPNRRAWASSRPHSTVLSRGFAPRCRRSASSWPTRLTSSGRRCR